MLQSQEQESTQASVLQKLRSASLNMKKGVPDEHKPYLILTSRALNKTIYSSFKSYEHESTQASLSQKLNRARLNVKNTIDLNLKLK